MPRDHRAARAHEYQTPEPPARERDRPRTRSTTPCAGPCNKLWRDAEQAREETGKEHDWRPTMGEPIWCDRCTQRVMRAVDDIPRAVVDIHNQAIYGTPQASERTGKHSRLAVAAWPGQSARLLIDEIRDALFSLEDDVRNLRGLTPRPDRGREGHAISGSVNFISAHLEWIVAHHPISDDVNDAPGNYLLRLYARANRFVGGGKAVAEIRPTPCPSCGGRSLAQQIGGKYIECGMPDCGRCLTREEYDQYTKMEASYQTALVAHLGDPASDCSDPTCVDHHQA